jgi:uncharacterized protein (DUF885 family)
MRGASTLLAAFAGSTIFLCGVPAGRASEAVEAARPAAARLADLIDREWSWRLEEFPLLATSVGVHEYDDRLEDASAAAEERRAEATRAFLAELDAIDAQALSAADRIDAGIFRSQLSDRLDSHRFHEELMPVNADSGFHTSFALLPLEVPLTTARDYANYCARLEAFPRWMDDHIALMREGLARGITVPKATLAGIELTIEPLAGADVEKHPLWAPFASFPASVPESAREGLAARGRRALADGVIPGYRRFLEFMTREYVPGARTTLAATALPDGEAYYRFLVREFTTLDLDPRQIHELGLAELTKIRKEMEAVIAKTGFHGTFAEFLAFLRTDPRFYARTPQELLEKAAWIAKRMDGKLPSLFATLPRQPYGIMPVPAALAPKYTSGRYSPSPPDSTQPGWYWVNTYALDKRPLYNLEALTLHEAVPGHHLQNAISLEQTDLRPFRRYSYLSAYGEGWGLYSEWLGKEAGFYTDPYSEFGFLGYQAWRAARLVVDTGLHEMGWSRERAIEYLKDNTSLPEVEATTEVDRYISWPGQALSYYLGYLEFRKLRAKAESELGSDFDVRSFHDEVLRHGSVPLPVLDRIVEDWIAGQRRATAR